MNWESQQQVSRDESELTSPHFDDEATLVSARKVVPLDEVAQKPFARSKLAQRLSLAMIGVLGLLVAIGLYSYLKPESDVTQTELNAKTASESSRKADGGVLQPVAKSDSESNAAGDSDQTVSKPATHSSEKVKVKDKIAETPVPAQVSRAEDEQSDLDEMQTLREIRREVRRQERQAIRERRRRGSRDGIFRVPDLFEGRSRP
jgi:hypothetical protein